MLHIEASSFGDIFIHKSQLLFPKPPVHGALLHAPHADRWGLKQTKIPPTSTPDSWGLKPKSPRNKSTPDASHPLTPTRSSLKATGTPSKMPRGALDLNRAKEAEACARTSSFISVTSKGKRPGSPQNSAAFCFLFSSSFCFSHFFSPGHLGHLQKKAAISQKI